jgi:hypothetical protein
MEFKQGYFKIIWIILEKQNIHHLDQRTETLAQSFLATLQS